MKRAHSTAFPGDDEEPSDTGVERTVAIQSNPITPPSPASEAVTEDQVTPPTSPSSAAEATAENSLTPITPPSSSDEAVTEDIATSSQQGQFCWECRKIDFQAIFAMLAHDTQDDIPYQGRAVTPWRKDFHAHCPLCDFILSFDSTGYGPLVREKGYWLHVARVARPFRRRSLVVIPGKSDDCKGPAPSYPWSPDGEQLEARSKGIMAHISSLVTVDGHLSSRAPPRGLFQALKVHPTQVDFALLRRWIQECNPSADCGSHLHCDTKIARRPNGTKVIDCCSRMIVPLAPNQEYLTLSYVWGKQTGVSSSGDGSANTVLPSAPAVIEDAMQVVRRLGQRYLWVDRVCISGDEDKHVQIQNMSLIYGEALATIVAVDGTHADCGLPGISYARRSQPTVDTSAGTFVSTMGHLPHHISQSKWGTRGWTYQEAMLSRRCLFFTKDQVFFACKGCVMSESVPEGGLYCTPDSFDSLRTRMMNINSYLELGGIKDETGDLFTLQNHLWEYTTRELTFSSDGLNAFRGILADRIYPSYWGIPFIHANPLIEKPLPQQITLAFSQGLGWFRSRRKGILRVGQRRAGFPSWSWASLSNPIIGACLITIWTDPLKVQAIGVEDSQGLTRPLSEFYEAEVVKGKLLPELRPYIRITGFVAKVNLRFERDSEDTQDLVVYDTVCFQRICREGLQDYSSRLEALQPGVARLDVAGDESLASRLEVETWDALHLNQWSWLLLDWNGSTTYRIGYFEGPTYALEGKVREIRLG